MRRRSTRLSGLGRALIAALVLLTETAPSAAAPLFRVQELLPPSGDVSAEATALNARGEVVGFSLNALGIPSALKWQSGRTEVLYQATAGRNLRGAKAFDINDVGQAVGVVLGYEEHPPPPYQVGGTDPIVWGAGDFRVPTCTLDDGAIKISNAGVVLNWANRVYSVDPADAAFLEARQAVGLRLYENGLVLNEEGTLGQALWGPLADSPWNDRRFWAETDLSTCGLPVSAESPWDAYICELARTGYERSRTLNTGVSTSSTTDNRAFLYTPYPSRRHSPPLSVADASDGGSPEHAAQGCVRRVRLAPATAGILASLRPIAGCPSTRLSELLGSAARSQKVLAHPAKRGGEGGIRTLGTAVHRISSPARSTTLPPLLVFPGSLGKGGL